MGPSVNNGEPAIDTNDWGTQLPSGSRQKIVNKILETLKKHLPFSEPEGINELKRIAVRFEEKVFSSAVHQTDYLRKLSFKMMIIETKDQSADGSFSSIPGDSNGPDLDELDNLMIDVERFLLKEELNCHQLRLETLTRHVPYSGQEGIEEIKRISVSFEELIFNTAINQEDYFRKISLKMQTMEKDD